MIGKWSQDAREQIREAYLLLMPGGRDTNFVRKAAVRIRQFVDFVDGSEDEFLSVLRVVARVSEQLTLAALHPDEQDHYANVARDYLVGIEEFFAAQTKEEE